MNSAVLEAPSAASKDFRTSLLFHSPLLLVFLWVFFTPKGKQTTAVSFTITEAPPKEAVPLQEVEQKPTVIRTKEAFPQKTATEVKPIFGASRNSLQSESSNISVKAGNTVAKDNDQEVLPAGDQTLPVPVDEYLVTSMPKIKKEIQIPYPSGAKARGVQGPVVMNLLIDASGSVREVSLVSGPDDELNAAALAAVQGIEFIPARIGDKSAPVRIRYTYRFVLEK